ncbi:unnamed protein product [Paramecium sonneborni]|uniref:Uncharacterized protein n=1 Tax=Paramecium sonneborni TaxID=65129 RepID=A0A8S1MJF4_9CILI|nr:unnamed protein product [Paramecium sonneborni]
MILGSMKVNWQILKIKLNSQKVQLIKDYKLLTKKEKKQKKNIDFIKKENQQQIAQGGFISGNVKQLQDISDMQNKKNVRWGEKQQEF